MGTRIDHIKSLWKSVRESLPRRLDESYTWAFWSAAVTSLYLMISVLLAAFQIEIRGSIHTISKPIIWVNAIVLTSYAVFSTLKRATDTEFHSTRIGRCFVGLWWLETTGIAVMHDLRPTKVVFPEDLLDIFLTVMGVLIVSDIAKVVVEKKIGGTGRKK